MATSTSTSTALSLKEYLKRYESGTEEKKKKKKKKTEKKTKTDAMGVLVVDEDPKWQKTVQLKEENGDDSADAEKPQVDEDIEVKRMKRLEQIRLNRPYHAISGDGSGWVSVSDAPKNSNIHNESTDLSPPRQRRAYETPSPETESKPVTSGDDVPDLSPPRQRRKRVDTPSPDASLNPSNSTTADRDFSPPRRSSSQTLSEFRKKYSDRHGSPNLSPIRRVRSHAPEVDVSAVPTMPVLSPPRKARKDPRISESSDLSPPRRVSCDLPVADLSPPRKNKRDTSSLKETARSGLFTVQEIKKEIDQIKKVEFQRFKEMDPSVSGRGAEPVYRDKEGKRISKDEFLKSQKGEEKPKI